MEEKYYIFVLSLRTPEETRGINKRHDPWSVLARWRQKTISLPVRHGRHVLGMSSNKFRAEVFGRCFGIVMGSIQRAAAELDNVLNYQQVTPSLESKR